MWSHAESSWTLLFARPWRLGSSALTALLARYASPRIVVSPMSDEWLRQLEASRRVGDP